MTICEKLKLFEFLHVYSCFYGGTIQSMHWIFAFLTPFQIKLNFNGFTENIFSVNGKRIPFISPRITSEFVTQFQYEMKINYN